MKNLPLVLGIVIVLVFGLLLIGYFLYEPSWWMLREKDLCSQSQANRDSAVKAIAAKGAVAIPRLRKWLKSNNEDLAVGACRAIALMEGNKWQSAIPELEDILSNVPSERTRYATEILFLKKGSPMMISKKCRKQISLFRTLASSQAMYCQRYAAYASSASDISDNLILSAAKTTILGGGNDSKFNFKYKQLSSGAAYSVYANPMQKRVGYVSLFINESGDIRWTVNVTAEQLAKGGESWTVLN